MIKIKLISTFFIVFFLNNISLAKEPSKLISEIVNEASVILSSSDPVEAKIIKLNNIAETNVDINGIGMYTLGKYRKNLNEDQKIKYNKLFKSYFFVKFFFFFIYIVKIVFRKLTILFMIYIPNI